MRLRIGLLLLLLFGTPACTKAKQTSPVITNTTAPELVATPPSKAPAKTRSRNLFGPRVLNYIGKNRQLVMHIDWELIRNSESYPLFEKLLGFLIASEIRAVEEACRLSPLSVLSSLTIAWQDSPDSKDLLLAVTGDVTEEELIACADKDPKTKIANAFWPQPNMVLFKKDAQAADLEKEVENGALVDDHNFMAELQTIRDPNAAIWALGFLPDSLRKSVGNSAGAAPTHFTMQVKLEADIDAVLTMYFDDVNDAMEMENKLNEFVPMLPMLLTDYSKLVSNLSIEVQDDTLRVLLRLSQGEVSDILRVGDVTEGPCVNSADPLCGL